MAFSVPKSLVVTLERVLGDETVGKCAILVFFHLASFFFSSVMKNYVAMWIKMFYSEHF